MKASRSCLAGRPSPGDHSQCREDSGWGWNLPSSMVVRLSLLGDSARLGSGNFRFMAAIRWHRRCFARGIPRRHQSSAGDFAAVLPLQWAVHARPRVAGRGSSRRPEAEPREPGSSTGHGLRDRDRFFRPFRALGIGVMRDPRAHALGYVVPSLRD
jgi:hypothetical protein